MPNKNQANIPVTKQTKQLFDDGLFEKMKGKFGNKLTYNDAILKLNEFSELILELFNNFQ